MLRYLSSVSLLASVVALPVQAANIVTSIKPLHFITYDITYGVSEPELLLNANASPHTYALKPSDIKKIAEADLMIWFGPELESFLSSAVKKSAADLELGASEKLSLREFGDEHDSHEEESHHTAHESGEHEHEHEHEEHEHHHHGTHDPHIWLGPEQARQAAGIIAERLAKVDPEHADIYQTNYQNFINELDLTVADIRKQLEPVKQYGYYVFHDAYGYFEDYFGMNKQGHFTVSPDRKPGAKTLLHIRAELEEGKAKCVFSEPQFKPAVIETVVSGSNVVTGKLDPLGTDIAVAKGSYFAFLRSIADGYSQCLGQ